jgi:hypothetical protein
MRTPVTLALVLAVGVAATGCGQHAPVNSNLSAQQQKALSASLAKLDDALKNASPFVFARLAPGATPDKIARLRSELGGAQIQSLELWYQWHDGCTDQTADLLPLGRMLSIEEALEDRNETQQIPLVDAKRKSALKILDDGAGDGFFLDIASPSPRVFYHMLEDPYPRDYGTLKEFVTFIRDVHAAGLASQNENGRVAFDLDRYQKMESEHLESISQATE